MNYISLKVKITLYTVLIIAVILILIGILATFNPQSVYETALFRNKVTTRQ